MNELKKQLDNCKTASSKSLTNMTEWSIKKYNDLHSKSDLRSIYRRYEIIEILLSHISLDRRLKKLNFLTEHND